MATNCKACDDLRTNAPNVLVNGIDSTACNSLKNNTGFNPATSTDNCADLEDANDCLIGMMEEEIEAYDVCDWKEYMKKFVPNVYTVIKGIICSMCGLWTLVTKLQCLVTALFDGTNYTFTREQFIEGTGVDMVGSDPNRSSMTLRVKGNVYRVHGSVDFNHSRWTNLGLTNAGNPRGDMNPADGGYRIGILKIKKSEYPEIKTLYNTTGGFTNAGISNVLIYTVDGDATDTYDRYYPGQWGWTDPQDHSRDSLVPKGYIYVCIQLVGLVTWGFTNSNNPKVTIDALGMASLNRAEVKC